MAEHTIAVTEPLGLAESYRRLSDASRHYTESAGAADAFTRNGVSVCDIEQSLLLYQELQSRDPSLVGSIPTCPYTWALAPNGYVYFANGLTKVRKWNGVTFEARDAGVPAPTLSFSLAGSGSGSITGTYTAYQRWLDEDGNPSNLSPVTASVTLANKATVTYTGVESPLTVSTLTVITRRQILRNTAGQALTYYVDVDTADLASTTFASTKTDAQLSAETPVPLFDSDGRSIATRFGTPPQNKSVIVSYLSRLFLGGEVTYDEGHAELTHGSVAVTGVGTHWRAALIGRRFYVTGHSESYIIAGVTDTTTMTLEEVYGGETDKFAVYSIRSAPGDRNVIYYTEAGQYDAWPPTATLAIDQNEDEVTALAPADSFLFVLMHRHIYRLTYNESPGLDGGLFLSCLRGCVNQRCWLYVDEDLYLLDEQGIYRFAGSAEAEPISGPIQDLFWQDLGERDRDSLRVNWKAQKFFHASHSREEQVLRWFVALGDNRLPRHALCFQYRREAWWVEEYPYVVGANASWEGTTGRQLLAGPSRRVLTPSRERLDGPTADSGTTRGTITSATQDSITDAWASFPASGLVGNPVTLVDGAGKGQRRIITSVSSQTLRVLHPWKVRPDATTVYQIGGINWRWKSGWLGWADEEMTNPRRVAVLFEPCASDNLMDLRIYEEHARTAKTWAFDYPASKADRQSIHCEKGKADAVIDLTDEQGFAQLRMDDGSERYVHASDTIAVELRGVSAPAPTRVYEIAVEGARQE